MKRQGLGLTSDGPEVCALEGLVGDGHHFKEEGKEDLP